MYLSCPLRLKSIPLSGGMFPICIMIYNWPGKVTCFGTWSVGFFALLPALERQLHIPTWCIKISIPMSFYRTLKFCKLWFTLDYLHTSHNRRQSCAAGIMKKHRGNLPMWRFTWNMFFHQSLATCCRKCMYYSIIQLCDIISDTQNAIGQCTKSRSSLQSIKYMPARAARSCKVRGKSSWLGWECSRYSAKFWPRMNRFFIDII